MRRDRLEQNAKTWRRLLTEAGFDIKAGKSLVVPVMLQDDYEEASAAAS